MQQGRAFLGAVLLSEYEQQTEQFASRVDPMEVDFHFRIERSADRLQFVEQLPAGVVVAWIEPLHDMDSAKHETVIHTPRHRVERTDRSKSFLASAVSHPYAPGLTPRGLQYGFLWTIAAWIFWFRKSVSSCCRSSTAMISSR